MIGSGYMDFSSPLTEKHRFVLPKDQNKYLVWSGDEFTEQQRHSTIWFLGNFYRKVKEQDIAQSISMIKKLSMCIKNGTKILDFVSIDSQIPGFFEWISSISRKPMLLRAIPLTYISSLILEYDDLVSVWGAYYEKKIKSIVLEYAALKYCSQMLVREIRSNEITELINICLQFDLIENPSSLLKNVSGKWPLEYRGYKTSKMIFPVDYELCYRIARGKPITFESVFFEKNINERSKMRHLLGKLNIQKRTRILSQGYWATNIIKTLVDILERNYNISFEDAVKEVCGKRNIYIDGRGQFVPIPDGQLDFFIALKELGLQPFRLSRQECKQVYGKVEKNPGFGLNVISRPHSIFLVTSKKVSDKNKTREFVSKMMDWQQQGNNVLTIWWNMHLCKTKHITASEVKKAITKLAEKQVPLAAEICSHFKD